jgi:Mn2+/Fe2+ NRAMP family transporter
VGHALMTWRPLLGGLSQDALLMILSNIGATVTPWMLFFQQSATVDKGLTRRDVRFGRIDVVLGALLAAGAAVGMLLVTAPLQAMHMSAERFQAAQFAQALQPVLGRFGASLFALGMVEAGMVAAITISTSTAYAFGEVASKPHSLNLRMSEGTAFYSVLFFCVGAAGAMVLIPGLPLVNVALIVNVIAVLAMPPALLFLLLLANDREIMGDMVSPRWANVLASAVVVLLIAAGVLFAASVLVPKTLAALIR